MVLPVFSSVNLGPSLGGSFKQLVSYQSFDRSVGHSCVA